MFRVFSLSTVALLFGSLLPAQDTEYTLKLYKPKMGDKTNYTKDKKDDGKLSFEFGGMSRTDNIAGGEKFAYTTEILEMKDGEKKPSKLRRVYEVAEKTEKKETNKLPFSGETVIIEKVNGKYTFTMNGKVMSDTDAEELDKEFNKKVEGPDNQDLLSKKPVKVGGTWTVDPQEIVKALEADGKLKIDPKKSSISGKLLKVYKKDNAQFGTIELTIELILKEMAFGGGETVPLNDGSSMKMTITVDACIDGTVGGETSKLEMITKLNAALPNNGKLVIEGKTTGTESATPVKK